MSTALSYLCVQNTLESEGKTKWRVLNKELLFLVLKLHSDVTSQSACQKAKLTGQMWRPQIEYVIGSLKHPSSSKQNYKFSTNRGMTPKLK